MTTYWLILAIAIATSLIGQTLLKAGATHARFVEQLIDWHTIVGLGFYAGAALLYIIALRKIPMSVALPCTAISYVAAMVIGHFAFAEPIGSAQLAAIGLISTGVLLLAFASI